MTTETEVRKRLDARLRPPLRDLEWERIHELGYVEDVTTRADTVDGVVGKVLELREAFGAGGATPRGSADPEQSLPAARAAGLDERSTAFALALSENLAVEADHDPEVSAFRDRHLPGGVIALDQVQSWIDERTPDPATTEVRTARVRIPLGWDADEPLTDPGGLVVEEIGARVLPYATPSAQYARKVVVAPGSVLDDLRRLAEDLVDAYGWDPAQASVWVLTGVTPIVGLIRITASRGPVRYSRLMEWSERITLAIHPAVPPEEVARVYRAARSDHDRERLPGVTRMRSQSTAHLLLARFVAARRTGTWDSKRLAWNDWITQQTQWPNLRRYDDTDQFRGDAWLARKRVLHRGYTSRRA